LSSPIKYACPIGKIIALEAESLYLVITISLAHEPQQLYNPDTLAQTQNVFLMQYQQYNRFIGCVHCTNDVQVRGTIKVSPEGKVTRMGFYHETFVFFN
jgi:hypothetical protein